MPGAGGMQGDSGRSLVGALLAAPVIPAKAGIQRILDPGSVSGVTIRATTGRAVQ